MHATATISDTSRFSRVSRLGGRFGALGVAAAIVVGGSGTTALVLAAQDGGPEGMIDRLVAIEQKLPTPPPDAILVDVETTWGEFPGDYVGARVQYDAVEAETRELFINADALKDADSQAVAEIARAILVMRQGYELLARAESKDLIFPLDTYDSTDTSTGADPAVGLYRAGLELYLDGIDRAKPAYDVLRNSAAADASEQALFASRYDTIVANETEFIPNLLKAIGYNTSQVLYTLSRFQSTAPGQNARARSMTVTCLDRNAYNAAILAGQAVPPPPPAEPAPTEPDPEAAQTDSTPGQAAMDALLAARDNIVVDCPNIDNENEVVLVDGG